MLLGNLDKEMRDFLGRAVPVMIPFFAFALGSGIDLAKVVQSGMLGVFLGLFVIFFSGIMLFLADKATGGNGVAGLSAATTAGNAAAVPALVAAANPAYDGGRQIRDRAGGRERRGHVAGGAVRHRLVGRAREGRRRRGRSRRAARQSVIP